MCLVVGVVVVVGVYDVDVLFFEFDEDERYAVYKSDDVGTPPVDFSPDFEFTNGDVGVFVRFCVVDDGGVSFFCCAVRFFEVYGDAVFDEVVFLAVGLEKGVCAAVGDECFFCLRCVLFGHPVVVLEEGLFQVAGEDYLVVVFAP